METGTLALTAVRPTEWADKPVGWTTRAPAEQIGTSSFQRRLAAILAADIAGYSRLIGLDEEGTLARLRSLRHQAIVPTVAAHRGRIVKTTGDGMLVEFQSVVDAVRCAVAMHGATAEHESAVPRERRIVFRVGINLGDIVVEGEDILGDGVNIAARLESMAEPGGICISALVHDQVRDRLGCAFEDLGEQRLKNIARPVRVFRIAAPSALSPGVQRRGGHAVEGQTPGTPNKPSLAVLPFQNMSGDLEQGYFVDGMVEEIITAMSHIRWLFVIARNSTSTYKGQAIDIKQIGQELGVRYVVEGSVRKCGNRVRITAQLVDAVTGGHLWADRFDGSLEDVFELQDKVASRVAGVIEPTLQAAETVRAVARPTADLTAYDLYLRASAMFVSSARQIPAALSLLERAIARDPRYGQALAWAAECCCRLHNDGRSADPAADAKKAVDYARRALEVASDEADILAHAAFALAYFGEDIGAMIALVDQALALNPSYARGWHISGRLRYWAGDPEAAIEHIETACALARVSASVRRSRPSARRNSWRGVLAKQRARCSSRSRKTRAALLPTAISPHATRIWAGSMTPKRW
jgi:TolB-like protein/class 3 adenylate cyclase